MLMPQIANEETLVICWGVFRRPAVLLKMLFGLCEIE